LLWSMALGGLAAMAWREYPALQRYLKIKSM
jgi:hypothetical protein